MCPFLGTATDLDYDEVSKFEIHWRQGQSGYSNQLIDFLSVLRLFSDLRTVNNFRGISEEDRGKGGERRGYRTVVNCSYGYRYQRYRYTRSNVNNKKFRKLRFFLRCYCQKLK